MNTRGTNLTTHLYLLLRLRMSGTTTPLFHMPSQCTERQFHPYCTPLNHAYLWLGTRNSKLHHFQNSGKAILVLEQVWVSYKPYSCTLECCNDGRMQVLGMCGWRTWALVHNVITQPLYSTFTLEGICSRKEQSYKSETLDMWHDTKAEGLAKKSRTNNNRFLHSTVSKIVKHKSLCFIHKINN